MNLPLTPYHIRIIVSSVEYGMVLAKDANGQPMWHRATAPTLSPAINIQGQTTYAATPPSQGQYYAVLDTSRGAGAYNYEEGRYRFGESVATDTGIVYPGPQVVVDTVNGASAFDGPVWCQVHYRDRDWVGAGSKVYFWDYTNNRWQKTAADPAGAATSVKITDIRDFGGVLLIAHDTTADYEWTDDEGATWHLPTGSGQKRGKHFTVREQRSAAPIFVMVNDPNILYQTEDPTDSDQWLGGTPVGDADDIGADHFTSVFTAPGGDLYIGKRLGLRKMDAFGNIDLAYHAQAAAGIGLENFAWAQPLGARVFVQVKDYDILMLGAGEPQPRFGVRYFGPQVPEMQRGVAALASDGSEWLYAALSGPEGYVMRGRFGPDGRWQWHGAYVKAGITINNRMWVSSHPLSGNTNSYLVISNSSAPYLPYRALIPNGDIQSDTDARFAPSSNISFGWQDGGMAHITKVLSKVDPVTRNLTASDTMQVLYRLNNADAYTSLATFTESPEPTVESTKYFPAGTRGTRWELKIVLTASTNLKRPAMERMVMRVYARPPRVDRIDCTVLAETGVFSRAGVDMGLSAAELLEALEAAKTAIVPPTLLRDWNPNTSPSLWTVDVESVEETFLNHADYKGVLAIRLTMQELPTITSVSHFISGLGHTHTMDTFEAPGDSCTLSFTPIVEPEVFSDEALLMGDGVDYTWSGITVSFTETNDATVRVRYAYMP